MKDQIAQLETAVDVAVKQLADLHERCNTYAEEKENWERERRTLQGLFDEANNRLEQVTQQLETLINDGV